MINTDTEFLDAKDRMILEEVFGDYFNDNIGFSRFWSYNELQLDGTFNVVELALFVRAMECMIKRNTTK